MGVARGVASGSGWNLWVWLLGVVVRRYIDFLILLIPTPLVSVLFLQQQPYFLFIFFKCFSFLHNYTNIYILHIHYIYTVHTYILKCMNSYVQYTHIHTKVYEVICTIHTHTYYSI